MSCVTSRNASALHRHRLRESVHVSALSSVSCASCHSAKLELEYMPQDDGVAFAVHCERAEERRR